MLTATIDKTPSTIAHLFQKKNRGIDRIRMKIEAEFAIFSCHWNAIYYWWQETVVSL